MSVPVSWAQRQLAGSFVGSIRVAYGGGVFVAVGDDSTILQRSLDGFLWESVTPANGYTGQFNCVEYSSTLRLFVAVGSDAEIQTSPDGETWTHRTPDAAFAGHFSAVAVSPTRILIGGTSGELQTSTDGVTWTHRTPAAGFAGTVVLAAYGGGYFVFCGISGAFQTQRSADGITWAQSAGYPLALSGLSYYGGLFFGSSVFQSGGINGRLYTSTDGDTWTLRYSSMENNVYRVAYDGEIFLAPCVRPEALSGATTHTNFIWSADGLSWSPVFDPDDPEDYGRLIHGYALNWLTFGENLFVGSGRLGALFTSPSVVHSFRIETGWLKPANYLGEFQCAKVGILGTKQGAGTLTVDVYHDYSDTVAQTVEFDLTNWDGSLDVLTFTLNQQRMSALRFAIYDDTEAEEEGIFTLTGLTLEIGVRSDRLIRPAVSKRGS